MGHLPSPDPGLTVTHSTDHMDSVTQWDQSQGSHIPEYNNHTWMPEEIAALCIVGILMPVIIFTNLLVIIAVVKFRRLQNTTNYFLVSLAIADVCTGLFAPILILAEVFRDEIHTPILCLGPGCLLMTFCGASMLLLAVIAYDRYVALTRPLEYIRVMTWKKVVIFTVIAWVYSAIIAWLPLMGLSDPMEEPDIICTYHLIRQEPLVVLLVCLFLPCYVVIFFCYARIYYIAKHHVSAIAAVQTSLQVQLEANFKVKNTKFAKTIAIVIGFFLLFWLPFQLCIVVELVSDIKISDWLRDYLAILSYCNSGINPWIYAFRNKDFKKAFAQVLDQWCHPCTKCRYEDPDDLSPKPRSAGTSRGGSLVPRNSAAFLSLDNSRQTSCTTLTSSTGADIHSSRSRSSTLAVLPEDILQQIPAITIGSPNGTLQRLSEINERVSSKYECEDNESSNCDNNEDLTTSGDNAQNILNVDTSVSTVNDVQGRRPNRDSSNHELRVSFSLPEVCTVTECVNYKLEDKL